MSDEIKKDIELKETDLEAAAGGATKDRWYPDVCNQKTRVEYECVGLLALTWCDHYRRENYGRDRGPYGGEFRHYCVKGRYDYDGNGMGDPV